VDTEYTDVLVGNLTLYTFDIVYRQWQTTCATIGTYAVHMCNVHGCVRAAHTLNGRVVLERWRVGCERNKLNYSAAIGVFQSVIIGTHQ
jgi:hypothetical protein